MSDWKPIETLPADRACDLVEMQCGNVVVAGWLATNLRCEPRVYFTWGADGTPKYVKPSTWRELRTTAPTVPSDHDYIPCVY